MLYINNYTRTNLKAMSVTVVGAKLWNERDSNFRNTKTILLFKKNQMGCTTHVCITCLSIFVLKNVVRRCILSPINIINLLNDDFNLEKVLVLNIYNIVHV